MKRISFSLASSKLNLKLKSKNYILCTGVSGCFSSSDRILFKTLFSLEDVKTDVTDLYYSQANCVV